MEDKADSDGAAAEVGATVFADGGSLVLAAKVAVAGSGFPLWSTVTVTTCAVLVTVVVPSAAAVCDSDSVLCL